MRLTLNLGGRNFDLCFTIWRDSDAEDEPEVESEDEPDERGDATSFSVGFTLPAIPWEDPGSAHQFDPGDGAEDV